MDAYRGEIQLTVNYLNTVQALEALGKDLKDFDPELLLQTTSYDRQELWRELRQLAEDHIQPPVGELVLRLLDRYQDLLLVCPAARLYHHPYLGGLLEHTWFVARHTLASLSVYPDLNPALALAGAILHDLGKVKEITSPTAPSSPWPGNFWATSSWAGRWCGRRPGPWSSLILISLFN